MIGQPSSRFRSHLEREEVQLFFPSLRVKSFFHLSELTAGNQAHSLQNFCGLWNFQVPTNHLGSWQIAESDSWGLDGGHVCVHAKLLQSVQLFATPSNCSPPGSSVHGILQARILEWASRALLQGIFPTQGSNPGLLGHLHWQAGSLPLSPPRKPGHADGSAFLRTTRDYSDAAGPQTPLGMVRRWTLTRVSWKRAPSLPWEALTWEDRPTRVGG